MGNNSTLAKKHVFAEIEAILCHDICENTLLVCIFPTKTINCAWASSLSPSDPFHAIVKFFLFCENLPVCAWSYCESGAIPPESHGIDSEPNGFKNFTE